MIMANEEAAAFERANAPLEKAQQPMKMWQQIRCLPRAGGHDCFHGLLVIVDSPMDLATARKRLMHTKNWQGPEVFARDISAW